MDITSASNFERLIYDIVDQDPKIVKELWAKIKTDRFFDISKTKYFDNVKKIGIVSGSANKKQRFATIKNIYSKTGIIIDPHTANGVFCAQEYKRLKVPVLCLATASPVKFEESIVEALGNVKLNRPAEYKDIEKKKQKFIKMDRNDLDLLKEFVANHAITD